MPISFNEARDLLNQYNREQTEYVEAERHLRELFARVPDDDEGWRERVQFLSAQFQTRVAAETQTYLATRLRSVPSEFQLPPEGLVDLNFGQQDPNLVFSSVWAPIRAVAADAPGRKPWSFLTKYLHFLRRDLYPLWDKRVAEGSGNAGFPWAVSPPSAAGSKDPQMQRVRYWRLMRCCQLQWAFLTPAQRTELLRQDEEMTGMVSTAVRVVDKVFWTHGA